LELGVTTFREVGGVLHQRALRGLGLRSRLKRKSRKASMR
jgi:hypothetical protein